jgi:hypothetical protein
MDEEKMERESEGTARTSPPARLNRRSSFRPLGRKQKGRRAGASGAERERQIEEGGGDFAFGERLARREDAGDRLPTADLLGV